MSCLLSQVESRVLNAVSLLSVLSLFQNEAHEAHDPVFSP